MKRRLLLLLIVIIQTIILLGCRQDKEIQPQNRVKETAKFIEVAFQDVVMQQTAIKELPVEEEVKIEYELEEVTVEEVQIETPRNDPVVLPITQRQANDLYPVSGESIATIDIPAIDLYQVVTYGDEQANIDAYDICLRTYHRFDQNGAILLAGHNYKSFASLKNLSIGNEIRVHSYYGDFIFIVDNVAIGTTDGENIYDSEGNMLIDFYDHENRLYLYTCDDSFSQGRVVVSAHKITI